VTDQAVSFLLDENVERQVLAYLRAEGYEGTHVVDALDTGAEDATEIAPYALNHDAVIVTKDTDFLAMDSSEHAGIFFVANHERSAYEIATAILRVLEAIPDRDHLRTVVFTGDWL
jgi:predicted nuclease of predicted toxin-antitoxin system